jgi:hypothetical protein
VQENNKGGRSRKRRSRKRRSRKRSSRERVERAVTEEVTTNRLTLTWTRRIEFACTLLTGSSQVRLIITLHQFYLYEEFIVKFLAKISNTSAPAHLAAEYLICNRTRAGEQSLLQ